MTTRRTAVVVSLLLAINMIPPLVDASQQAIQLVGPTASQLQQGRTYDIQWLGEGVESVQITAEGDLTSLPDKPRGAFSIKIADAAPASGESFAWEVPFIDSARIDIHIRGYDRDGRFVGEDSRLYAFRPDILANRRADGIYVDLRDPKEQRMYVMRKNIVIRVYLTSGAYTHVGIPKPQNSSAIHDPVGVFRVTEKIPMYWSKQYQVWMTHAMRVWQGHFIHGTYPSEYPYLGTPASSGCIRLHRTDAKELFGMAPIGTRVEIFE